VKKESRKQAQKADAKKTLKLNVRRNLPTTATAATSPSMRSTATCRKWTVSLLSSISLKWKSEKSAETR
jgi:hypothetical protein